MLLQLGESGNLSIGVGDASLGELHLSLRVDEELLSDEEPYQVSRGDVITGHAQLIDPSETGRFQNSTVVYEWHLNGERMDAENGDEETITVDSSELDAGQYSLQAWAIVGLTDPVYFTDEVLFTVE